MPQHFVRLREYKADRRATRQALKLKAKEIKAVLKPLVEDVAKLKEERDNRAGRIAVFIALGSTGSISFMIEVARLFGWIK